MRVSSGPFSWSFRRWWSTHQPRHVFQVQAGLHRRNFTDATQGNSFTFQCYGSGIARNCFSSCAGTEHTYSDITTATVRKPLSGYNSCTDTFVSCTRSNFCAKKPSSSPGTASSLTGSNTATALSNSRSTGAHSDLTAGTDGRPKCTGYTGDAFTCSQSTIFPSRRARLLHNSFSTFVGNDTSTPTLAAENLVEKRDSNPLVDGQCHVKTFPTPAFSGLGNVNGAGHTTQRQSEVPCEWTKLVLHTPSRKLSYESKGVLRGTTGNNVGERFVSASMASMSTTVVKPSRVMHCGAQNDTSVCRTSLKREISIGRCYGLASSRVEGNILLPFVPTRTFFLAKITKTGATSAASGSGSAAVAGGQSSANAETCEATSAHEANKRFFAVDSKSGGKEKEGTTQSARSGSTTGSTSISLSTAELSPLPGGTDMNNISQLKVSEEEGKLVRQGKSSAFPLWFSRSTAKQKNDGDVLSCAGPTDSVKEKIPRKSAKTPLSKKLGSFIFGFFVASGCSFFIMYWEVADATLLLQQAAKDASHRLAILESRMLELEKRCP